MNRKTAWNTASIEILHHITLNQLWAVITNLDTERQFMLIRQVMSMWSAEECERIQQHLKEARA